MPAFQGGVLREGEPQKRKNKRTVDAKNKEFKTNNCNSMWW